GAVRDRPAGRRRRGRGRARPRRAGRMGATRLALAYARCENASPSTLSTDETVSAMRSSREPSARAERAGSQPREGAELRERRRSARRRQRLARIDLGLGGAGALVLLLATSGLAIAAVIALVVLVLCALSV